MVVRRIVIVVIALALCACSSSALSNTGGPTPSGGASPATTTQVPTPTPSSTATPIPTPTMVNGRMTVSNLDDNGAAVVAGFLYPSSGSSCGVNGSYDACPVTDGLAARLDANPLKSAEPLCRCQNVYQSVAITTEPLGEGNPGAIAHVVLVFGAGSTVKLDITVLRTDGGWFASDTSCTGQDSTATSIYAASPAPCNQNPSPTASPAPTT